AACAGAPSRPAPFNTSIEQSALIADVQTIAHDSTRGRLVGTPEIARVADWIGERFRTLGLEPAGDDGTYDQRFDLMWFSLGTGSRLDIGGETREPGNEWYPLSFSATTSAEGDVV